MVAPKPKADKNEDDGGKEPRKIIPKGTNLSAVGQGDEAKEKIKAQMSREDQIKYLVIGISVGAMVILLAIAVLMYMNDMSFVLARWESPVDESYSVENKIEIQALTMGLFGVLAASGPIGIYFYLANRRIENLEARLGDFLRDLAESARSGQTLHQSIRTASGGDYGSLSPEIKTMAHQISWGVAATDALEGFAERVNTPLVLRAVTLIIEASNAGGEVAKVLDAAATDTREIQLLRQERKVEMGMYVMVIMIAFFVFLVVIAIVYQTFVPQMKRLAQSFKDSGQSGGGTPGGMDPSTVDFEEVKFLYILAGGVNGIGCGLTAGLMGSGRITDGFRFVFVMVLVNVVAFTFLLTG